MKHPVCLNDCYKYMKRVGGGRSNGPEKQGNENPSGSRGTKKTVTRKAATPTKAKTTKAVKSGPGPSTKQLKIGQKAPAFALPNQDGKIMRLSDFKGKKVVLYFYPKDDTRVVPKSPAPFVTAWKNSCQRCGGAGISADSVDSHKKFVKKFNLNFPLLSDEKKTVVQAYGVWKEKSLYGPEIHGHRAHDVHYR